MKGKRYTEEQIIGILNEHEAGVPAQEVIRKHGIASGTFYRWKSKFGGMEVSEANREALAIKGEELRAQRATREPRA